MNKKSFFVSMLVTLLIAGILYFGFQFFFSFNGKQGDYNSFLNKPESGRVNVLVVGVDKEGIRSDVNMIFSVDPESKTVRLLSVPRDTRVKLPSGSYGKINACIGKENGEALLTDTVRELTGLPIHHFCKIDIYGLRDIVDILGGVEFDVPMDMDYDDPAQDLHIHLKQGKQVLNGEQAEGLLRFRSGYANADLGRIDMQQQFIKEAAKQKLKLRYIFKIVPVISKVRENLNTDLSATELVSLAWSFKNGNKADVQTYTLPGAPKTIGGVSYYVCDENATQTLIKTQFGFDAGEEISAGNNPLSEKVIE